MLELENVYLSYQSGKASFDHGVHRVLDDVSLKVYEGETLGIIGRNGVGKTSILRVMAGILAPNSGQVRQRPGTTSSLLTIGLGFKPELSGRDNALLSMMLQGNTRQQALAYLEEIQGFSELGDSFNEPVKTYSTGMRSRLGFSTAMVSHVDILMIDEALAAGDARFRNKAEAAMKERISGKQTVVFVSHVEAQVEKLCDRAILLDRGRVAAEGDTHSVLLEYQSRLANGSGPKGGKTSA